MTPTPKTAPKEHLTEINTKDLDPKDRAKKYIDTAIELVNQAKDELMKNNIKQASKKIWNACILAIKAHALWKNKKPLTQYTELWKYKDKIITELGEQARDAWIYANIINVNSYEENVSKDDVKRALKLVKELVETIARRMYPMNE